MMNDERMTPEEALEYALRNLSDDEVFEKLNHNSYINYLYSETTLLHDIESEAVDNAINNSSVDEFYNWSDVATAFSDELDDYVDDALGNYMDSHSLTEIRKTHYEGEWFDVDEGEIVELFDHLIGGTPTDYPLLGTLYRKCVETIPDGRVLDNEKEQLLEAITEDNNNQ